MLLVIVLAPLKLIHEAHEPKESLIAKKYAPAGDWHDLFEWIDAVVGSAGIEPVSMNYTNRGRMFMTAQSGLGLIRYGLGRN